MLPLDASGVPVAESVTGNNYLKAPVNSIVPGKVVDLDPVAVIPLRIWQMCGTWCSR